MEGGGEGKGGEKGWSQPAINVQRLGERSNVANNCDVLREAFISIARARNSNAHIAAQGEKNKNKNNKN